MINKSINKSIIKSIIKNYLIFLHIIILLYLVLYALIIKNTKYDYIYIIFLYCIIIHWLFLKGECILSYLFQKIKNNNYSLGTDFKNDDYYYLFGKYRNNILLIKNILVTLNIYILYKRNDSYKSIIIIMIILYICVKYKYPHIN
jgi:hypothetical protein